MLSADQLNDLRQKVLRGEEIPREQMREVLESLRKRRAEDIAAASATKERKAKAEKAAPVDLDVLLNIKKAE